jgi:predicted SnoaL-like aldol condensation-catalyzing enzyme
MNRKNKIHQLLKVIETGDAAATTVVNPDKYIQHNPQTKEGGEGLAALFKRIAKTSPRVNIVRLFEDGDYVFGHTEYEFSQSNIGFEVFRFEGDQTVEHWDNIQPRKGPNPSGHTMVDGPTDVVDIERTEPNRALVKSFINDVLINRQLDQLPHYINVKHYTEHNPRMRNLDDLTGALKAKQANGSDAIDYGQAHRLLAEGNFVLSVCEGYYQGVHSSFYDLFRLDNGKIVEHWDTTEAVPPQAAWQNNNGKF